MITAAFLTSALLAWICSFRTESVRAWFKISLICAAAVPVLDITLLTTGLLYQAGKHHLSREKINYMLSFSAGGIGVIYKTEHVNFDWDHVYHVYRVKDCIYLYMAEQQAYLLPEAENSEDVWNRILACVPPEKITDLAK